MTDRDPASFDTPDHPPEPLPDDVAQRLHDRLAEDAQRRLELGLTAGAQVLRSRPIALPRPVSPLRHPLTWGLAFGVAAAAVLVFALVQPAPPEPPAAGLERPAAFTDGGPPSGSGLVLERDAAGRVRQLAPAHGDGDHLIFRGERLIRIEPRKAGALDGVVVELDGAGGIIALRTYAAGVERGPWVELDGKGRVTASGTR